MLFSLSQVQKEMRLQWIIDELKNQYVLYRIWIYYLLSHRFILPKEAVLEAKYCAIPSPEHVFRFRISLMIII